MEPLFKNKTTLSKKNYIQLVKFHQKKNNWKYWLYTSAFSLLFIFFTSFQFTLKNYLLACFLILCFLVFLAYRFIHPYYKTNKELHSENIKNNLVNYYLFYEKYFRIKNKKGNSKIRYSKVHKVYENNSFFYLYLANNYAFIIEKNGFIIGNSNSFEKFIKSKLKFKFKGN